ncbi:hypothetical protein [Arthrobacter sp. MDT1-65]
MNKYALTAALLSTVLALSACIPQVEINFDGRATSCAENPGARECEDGAYVQADALLSASLSDQEYERRVLGVIRAVVVPVDLQRLEGDTDNLVTLAQGTPTLNLTKKDCVRPAILDFLEAQRRNSEYSELSEAALRSALLTEWTPEPWSVVVEMYQDSVVEAKDTAVQLNNYGHLTTLHAVLAGCASQAS